MDISSLHTKKITVIGAVRSGLAVAKLLKSSGADVFVSDSAPPDKLQTQIAELEAGKIPYEAGNHSDRVFNCELMVISPGVPGDAPVVTGAQKKSIKVVSELEVGSWFCRAPIVAITGSNGKTTTTTLTGRILADAKKKHAVAGNIGTAFSSVVLELAETDIAVLEVSSFQLDFIEKFRPAISVLLNITPDHMDRYGHSMENYSLSKGRIFKNQSGQDILIYDADDEWTNKIISGAKCHKIGFSTRRALSEGAFLDGNYIVADVDGSRKKIIDVNQIYIKGMHNIYNSMAASLVGISLGISGESIRSTLKTFEGVEHRLEFVREIAGVKYYNDSKATNVDSVWYALQAFKEPIILILGGRDKGNDYSPLNDLVAKNVKEIIAVGESADKVEKAFRNIAPVTEANSMDDAVQKARRLSRPGYVVLLSPACASFDWFINYEHRGNVFKEIVGNL